MVVQHNMQAANASRMLNITAGQQAKSTEKLSSGYRINRAADDAAGLSISEKMRKQIKGLDRASTNAQDGVSAVQTAEGALTEVHSMLQRMNELTVQSANGTNSQSDRDAIQAEIDQLSEEIDRVSTTTKFNETYLLKGDSTKAGEANFYKSSYCMAKPLYVQGETNQIADSDALKKALAEGKKIYTEAAGADKQDKNTTSTLAIEGTDYAYATKLYDENGKEVSATDVKAVKQSDGTTAANKYFADAAMSVEVKTADAAKMVRTEKVNGTLNFNLHVGADSSSDNKIGVQIDAMSAAGIGVKGLKVDTEDDATVAIDTISQAIQKVSTQRSNLGAVQNRLEHTIDNLDNVVENTTSAESRIRDTDMADEMVKYSKNNILTQAGQSMLAQANQSTQGVLSLLQ